jgi:hypothetical protein
MSEDSKMLTEQLSLEFLIEILNQIFDDIDGETQEKYIKIEKECVNLFEFYKGPALMNTQQKDIDYSIPEVRFAYVYRNTGLHSIILCNILANNPELHSMWKKDNITITSFGGGSGSDALGIGLYCLNSKSSANVVIWNFDRVLWQDCWIGIRDSNSCVPPNISWNFAEFDATKAQRKMPKETDLVTMLYFVSEMYRYKDQFCEFLGHAINQFKSGTLFLVIEMLWFQFSDWVSSSFKKLGLQPYIEWKKCSVNFDESYFNILNPHYDNLLKLNPKNKPRSFDRTVQYSLWKKP